MRSTYERRNMQSEASVVVDPIDALPPLCVQSILQNLSAPDLARCCALSRVWNSIARHDRFWESHCEALWTDKAYVPARIKQQASSRKLAFALSLREGERRVLSEVSPELHGVARACRMPPCAG